MIISFGNQLAQDIFDDRKSKLTRHFPAELYRVARRKILYLHDADNLTDLRVPPGNRLEPLKGKLQGFYSIRINDQWRVIFKWSDGGAFEVKILDYHK